MDYTGAQNATTFTTFFFLHAKSRKVHTIIGYSAWHPFVLNYNVMQAPNGRKRVKVIQGWTQTF